MNKLKNIGISALAGTLVSLSAAQAGGVSVTGVWELSYTNLHHEKVTGNKIGMKKNITFGSSGDISDGGAVTWGTTIVMNDAMSGLSSASMNINMGGIATLAYDSGTGGYGANAVDNIVPTAWEEIDYGFSTGITDLGVVSSSKGVVNLTVKAPVSGAGISISYVAKTGGGHIADGGTDADTAGHKGADLVVDLIDYDAKHFGLRMGVAGQIEFPETTCKDQDKSGRTLSCLVGHKNNPIGGSSYVSLKLGPIHLGTQATIKDPADPTIAGIANKRSIVAGAALLVGDTISISYGSAWDKYKFNNEARGDDTGLSGRDSCSVYSSCEYEMVRFRGFSAAVNMGPVALKATRNRVSGAGENATGSPKQHSEVNLSIAF